MPGGSSGIRDAVGLQSALATPQATFGGEFLHVSVPAMAAAYLFHLCQNHAFIDGNKRTAVYMMMLVLERSGYELKLRRGENLNDAVETMVTDVVEHKLGFADLVEWFKQRIMALPHE